MRKNSGFSLFSGKFFDDLFTLLCLNFDSHHYARLNKEVPSSMGFLPQQLTAAATHHYARRDEQVPIPVIFVDISFGRGIVINRMDVLMEETHIQYF
jgi:hypothetical protein